MLLALSSQQHATALEAIASATARCMAGHPKVSSYCSPVTSCYRRCRIEQRLLVLIASYSIADVFVAVKAGLREGHIRNYIDTASRAVLDQSLVNLNSTAALARQRQWAQQARVACNVLAQQLHVLIHIPRVNTRTAACPAPGNCPL